MDAVGIGTSLWNQPAVRQTLAAQVEKYQLPPNASPADIGAALDELQKNLQGLPIPVGWSFSPVQYDPQVERCTLRFSDPAKQVYGLAFAGQCLVWANSPGDLQGWGIKIVGILALAVAAMQGAPFWFDLLQKIVNVRSTGSKPEKEK